MHRTLNVPTYLAFLCSLLGQALAVEVNVESEKRSYLPLIPNSTYTYNGEFKGRKSTETVVVQTARIAETDLFYFISEKDLRNPEAILGTTTIGLGVFVKAADGLATLDIFFKHELNTLKKSKIASAVTILKNTPEQGAEILVPSPEKMTSHTYRVDGTETVTVPAGTFNDCLKITIAEINLAKPPEKDIVYTGTAWLARGVGVVKWIRGTGRIEELAAFKLADAPAK